MADEIRTITKQNTYASTPEGSLGFLRLNPIGNLCASDPIIQLALDGRVFNASNAVQETLEDISYTTRGSVNINPALLLDVPTGKTAVPLEVLVDQGFDGADEDIQFTINTDAKVRYVSGGGTITPVNMRKDDIRTSGCVVFCGSTKIVISSNTDDDTIYSSWLPATAHPKTDTGVPTFLWTARKNMPPVLVGPASFQVFIVTTTADQTYMWSMKWAEFDTVDVIRS